MDIESSEHSNWLIDYGIVDGNLDWVSQAAFNASSDARLDNPTKKDRVFPLATSAICSSMKVDCSVVDSDSPNEAGSCKRLKSESSRVNGSKACREKMRRDRLNERHDNVFLELGYILEPGRPPKTDKAAILSDAVRMLTQLRSEALQLSESNEDLQIKIRELKAEKNELRDEKQKLKADKEKLEQQVKAMSAPTGFLSHPSTMSAAFAAQSQTAGKKLVPFIGYPGVAMWQFMPPAAVDTSQDHVLRPPVA
ncbi:hypothetical protein JRO89_XSUnG0101100 [Xanthoceras sorbifolium]|uniref:BHLH domain-containing protein n=1 Tax=Xanthoceras sorbifolium TaxID=99658 RepID=A0ABQ8GYN4_9ROSI|nr:hypothetical protein JRO89_XSUnG0101100 [Xanthoceras sorbifolium]